MTIFLSRFWKKGVRLMTSSGFECGKGSKTPLDITAISQAVLPASCGSLELLVPELTPARQVLGEASLGNSSCCMRSIDLDAREGKRSLSDCQISGILFPKLSDLTGICPTHNGSMMFSPSTHNLQSSDDISHSIAMNHHLPFLSPLLKYLSSPSPLTDLFSSSLTSSLTLCL